MGSGMWFSWLGISSAWAQDLGASPGPQMDVWHILSHSGLVVQSVLYILILFSVASWGTIFFKLRQIRVARRQTARFIEIFWDTKNLTAIHTASQELRESPVAQVFRAGYQELLRLTRARRPGGMNPVEDTDLGGVDNVERAMRRAIRQEVTRLERALTFLATTASATPFIGLFGTVWGIMNAFLGLSQTQSSSIQAVAPGIAEALIATATGLVAAIPAVIGYNHFTRQIRVLTAEMENFASEFLNIAERHFLK
ncbi:Biopolymer transport protein ExbB [bacterium HR30]|nr:Biopolymer transport protein ExbB [bacterium HR30]